MRLTDPLPFPTGEEFARTLSRFGVIVGTAAIGLVFVLTAFGRGPRLAHWLHPLYAFAFDTIWPLAVRFGGGCLALLGASVVIGWVLLHLAGARRVQTGTLERRADLGPGEASRHLGLAGTRLERLGYRQRRSDTPSGTAVTWSRRASWWSEDPRLLRQEVHLCVEGDALTITHRLWSRGLDGGEEAYRAWLVQQLVRGEDLDTPPRTLLWPAVIHFVHSVALIACAGLLALVPVEAPWWLFLAIFVSGLATLLVAPLMLPFAVLSRRFVAGGRLFAYACGLTLVAEVLAFQAPSGWEIERGDDARTTLDAYASALRDSHMNVVTWQLPLTSFELRAARRRCVLERRILDGGATMAMALVDAFPEASPPLRTHIERLLERMGEPARAALRYAADHREPEGRALAGRLLRRLPVTAATLDVLARLMSDPDRDVRLAAVNAPDLPYEPCQASECIVERGLVEDYRDRLADPDLVIRRAAASVLGKLRDRRSVAALIAIARSDEEGALALAALHEIERIADPDSEGLLTSLLDDLVVTCGASSDGTARDLVYGTASALAALGPSLIGRLLDLIGTPYESEALSALSALHERPEIDLSRNALDRLVVFAADPRDRPRRAALELLARATDPSAIATTVAAVAGTDGFVVVRPLLSRGLVPMAAFARWAQVDSPEVEEIVLQRPLPDCTTAIALDIVLDPRRADDLRRRLLLELNKTNDESLDPCWAELVARSDAIRLPRFLFWPLDSLEPPLETGTLIELLGSRWSGVRAAAAGALGSREETRVVPTLLHLLESPDEADRNAAAEALGRLRAGAAVPALVKMLDAFPLDLGDPAASGNDATTLVTALGSIGDPAARPALGRFVVCSSAFACRLSGRFPSTMGTYVAAAALASTGDTSVLPLLRSAIERPPPTRYDDVGYNGVVDRATRALARLGSDGERELRDLLVVDAAVRPALEELGRMRSEGAFELLAGYLSDPRYEVRAAALIGLEALGDPRAIPLAVAAIDDRAGWIVRVAADVVSTLGHTDFGLRWYKTLGKVRLGFDEVRTREAVREWAVAHGIEVSKPSTAVATTARPD